jgi:cephalosporin hydroxylase
LLNLRPKKFMWLQFRNLYNPLRRLLSEQAPAAAGFAELSQIRQRAEQNPSDISDHLVSLFVESFTARPKLIVELGVRGGESTFVLERVASLLKAKLISVDIEPCSKVCQYPGWMFVQKDDVQFAREFESYCAGKNITPEIDLLFIDSSHLYEHSVEEIRSWFPLLGQRAKVIFHDTNMREIYFKKNGSVAFGWDNKRGVIRAIEERLGCRFNEGVDFYDFKKGWFVRHTAASNGFTVLERFALEDEPPQGGLQNR